MKQSKPVRSPWSKAKTRIANDKRGRLIKTFVEAGFRVKANGVRLQRVGDWLEVE